MRSNSTRHPTADQMPQFSIQVILAAIAQIYESYEATQRAQASEPIRTSPQINPNNPQVQQILLALRELYYIYLANSEQFAYEFNASSNPQQRPSFCGGDNSPDSNGPSGGGGPSGDDDVPSGGDSPSVSDEADESDEEYDSATPESPNFYQRHIRGGIQQFFQGLVNFFAKLIDPIINFGYKDFFSSMFDKTCSFFQSIGSKIVNAVSSLASICDDISSSAQTCANDFRAYAASAENFSSFFRTNSAEGTPGSQNPQTPQGPSATDGPTPS